MTEPWAGPDWFPQGVSQPKSLPDKKRSISSHVVRGVYDGQQAVVVNADQTNAHRQITALVDVLSIWLAESDADDAAPPDPTGVVVICGNKQGSAKRTLQALRTQVAALAGGPPVRLFSFDDPRGPLRPADGAPPDFACSDRAVAWSEHFNQLYGTGHRPPETALELVHQVGYSGLRLYPRLTGGDWSVRLDGLEVGRVDLDGTGWLNVGKTVTSAKGERISNVRKLWIDLTESEDRLEFGPGQHLDVLDAAHRLNLFVQPLLGRRTELRELLPREHVLESQVLRGAARVEVNGQPLSLVRPKSASADDAVNWGSQFPAQWWVGGRARYLDALLCHASTPWAVELKARGSAGVASYYRHAIAQAVLYRHFIQTVAPLHGCIREHLGLDARACQAAVAVPAMEAGSVQWRDQLKRLCELFNVSFVEIPNDPPSASRRLINP